MVAFVVMALALAVVLAFDAALLVIESRRHGG